MPAKQRITAPPSPGYQDVAAARTRTSRIKTLRGKQTTWSQAEQNELLKLLLDDYLARHPQT